MPTEEQIIARKAIPPERMAKCPECENEYPESAGFCHRCDERSYFRHCLLDAIRGITELHLPSQYMTETDVEDIIKEAVEEGVALAKAAIAGRKKGGE